MAVNVDSMMAPGGSAGRVAAVEPVEETGGLA